MATAADQATDSLHNLSLDPKKTPEVPEVPKKAPASSGEAPTIPLPPSNQSAAHLQEYADPNMWYPSPAYYYGGYDGSIPEWEDYSRYASPEVTEMSPHGVYGDMYRYGYAPYSPYPSPSSPVPSMGHDGQLYGAQPYQYTTQYYQSPAPPAAPASTGQPSNSRPEASVAISTDKLAAAADTSKAKVNGFVNGSASIQSRPSQQAQPLSSNGSYVRGGGALPGGVLPASTYYQDMRYGFDGTRSLIPWYDASALYDGKRGHTGIGSGSSMTTHAGGNFSTRNQNIHHIPHYLGLHTPRPQSSITPATSAFLNRAYPSSRTYGQCGTGLRTGYGYGSNGRWGYVTDSWKFRPNDRGNGLYSYGNENLDEMNKGPRSDRSKTQKGPGSYVTIASKGQHLNSNGSVDDSVAVPARDQYNKDDFPELYSDAKFFIIKSYSEDDVHKSVKYNVWASTPNGNKKLDAAYREAQEKSDGCPVFLLFSVNTSGQFVGAAEMVGPVDFDKTVPYWQQDKWNGCFPVKWHIVKDVPNSILKHIILDNNEGKPVTNSRDTQEVKLEQGIQMLKLFKEHISKTCILDDFGFYETRQKVMLERRASSAQKQTPNVKATDAVDGVQEAEGPNVRIRLQKPMEVVSLLKKDSPLRAPELKLPEENGVAGGDAVSPKQAVLPEASEKPIIESDAVDES